MNQSIDNRSIWWAAARFVRRRALALIAIVSVIKLSADLGADAVWWLETPVHFQPQYAVTLLLSVIALVWACWIGRKVTRTEKVGAIVAALIGGQAATVAYSWTPAQQALSPPAHQPIEPQERGFRILSANVQTDNQQYDAAVELVRAVAPDVVLLTELNSRWESALLPLDEDYTFHRIQASDRGNFGIGVWSKLPVESFRFEDFGTTLPQVQMVLRLPVRGREDGPRFRFIALHTPPPIMPEFIARRDAIYDGVVELCTTEPRLPVVVAGDLNNTRFSNSFQRLCSRSGLFDAGYGSGVWRTWPAAPPLAFMGVRIDHVLVAADWHVKLFRRGPDIGSDHLPVIAELRLASPTR